MKILDRLDSDNLIAAVVYVCVVVCTLAVLLFANSYMARDRDDTPCHTIHHNKES